MIENTASRAIQVSRQQNGNEYTNRKSLKSETWKNKKQQILAWNSDFELIATAYI